MWKQYELNFNNNNKELDFRKVELYKLTTFCLYGSVV